MDSSFSRRNLPLFWSLWLPLVPVTLLLVTGLFFPDIYKSLVYKEGPVEWLTVAVALFGAGLAFVAFRHRAALPNRWLRCLPMLLLVGQVYIAGEESSWGQHILNPRLPGDPETVKNQGVANTDPRSKYAVTGEEREEALKQLSFLKRINDQGEINFHNLPGFWGDLFGKLPKQAVEFGSFIGCVIVPLFLVRKLKLDVPGTVAWWLAPTRATTVAALIAFLLPWPKRIVEMFVEKSHTFLRLSEPQELYLAIVIALYTGTLAVRLASEAARDVSATAAAPLPAR